MADLDADVENLHLQMENFLRSIARREPTPSHPIVLKIEYKNSLKLIDKAKHQFSVQESFLSAFRDIYTDRAFKTVRLHNWQFELEFEGKRCKKIALIANTVIFLANKNNKKEITGCHFKLFIVDKEEDLKKFSNELNGYLNRLGKRHLCSYSNNIAKETPSLLSFVPLEKKEAPKFNYKPFVKPGQEMPDPLTTVTTEGKKVMEKLRHFVSRQQIYDFILQQEVSKEAADELKKLAIGGK